MLILLLYEFALVSLLKSKECSDSDADLANLVKELYGRLDPAIRNHLLKRGISVVQNNYVGFDTEYKNIDAKHNKLLTVQLAVNSKTFVKIPKPSDFSLASVNPLTQDVYASGEIPGFETKKLEQIINNIVKRVRAIRYPFNDESVFKLAAGFKKGGLPFIEKEDTYIFSLPLSDIQPILFIAAGSEISFADLVKKSNEVSSKAAEETYQRVIALIKGF